MAVVLLLCQVDVPQPGHVEMGAAGVVGVEQRLIAALALRAAVVAKERSGFLVLVVGGGYAGTRSRCRLFCDWPP